MAFEQKNGSNEGGIILKDLSFFFLVLFIQFIELMIINEILNNNLKSNHMANLFNNDNIYIINSLF